MLAVPNVSEGRDQAALHAIAHAFGPGLVHWSSDPVHNRAVFTITGEHVHEAVLDGAREAIARLDLRAHEGIHPRVGVVDVAPIVYLSDEQRGAACAEALVLADELGRLGVPVYLYGELAGGRTRAELRRDLTPYTPDFGPPTHPTAGATLVAARPPLVAFNVEIEASLDTAKQIAHTLRSTLDVRALGLQADVVQVSTNIENGRTMAEVVRAVQRHATVTGAELVAPAPRAAFADFPQDVPLRAPKPLEDHLLS
jgi:glutamate formiminotransferase